MEPAYRSKFPPLGLLRISSYHKEKGDFVIFVRGKVPEMRNRNWNRVYVSSLFTYELPRTIDTIKYYSRTVPDPSGDIFVGGIGATLLPSYIRERVACKIIEGPLNRNDMLGKGTPPIDSYIPDYDIIKSISYKYKPDDAYFFRVTVGCIRECTFCAVPKLEPKFSFLDNFYKQIRAANEKFGERQNMILMDNNILAVDDLENVIADIRNAGFEAGAKRNGRKRIVDINQGIDARLITSDIATLLSTINLEPIRLAFDFVGMEKQYKQAIDLLVKVGFSSFTNYVMFNFNDDPKSLYHRLKVNIEESQKHGIRITSFPMRYVPIDDVNRRYVSRGWQWRYLRGIQCVLNATHGVVSPNANFFEGAFGKTYEEFLEILSMPDQYIIYRKVFENNKALDWKTAFRKLPESDREDFLGILAQLNKSKNRQSEIRNYKKYISLLEHYYPNGKSFIL